MHSFEIALNAVAPLFMLMAAGFIVRRAGMVDEHSLSRLNKLITYLFLPALLFCNVYGSDWSTAVNPLVIGYLALSVVISVAALWFIIPCLEPENCKRGVIIQGIFRSNAAIFGVPIAASLLGEGSLGLVAVLISVTVVLYNCFAVIVLERFNGKSTNAKAILLGVIRNPLILSILAAIALKLVGLKLPEILFSPLNSLGSVTAPLGFVLLGASFSFKSAKAHRRTLVFTVLSRLVIVPLVFLIPAYLLGIREHALVVLMIIYAAPTALSSFPMAKEFGGDDALAGEIVVFTSALCILTLFVWIYAFSALGLLPG
ncbi:MAG: AEC family transporter [Bacillota bacterium]